MPIRELVAGNSLLQTILGEPPARVEVKKPKWREVEAALQELRRHSVGSVMLHSAGKSMMVLNVEGYVTCQIMNPDGGSALLMDGSRLLEAAQTYYETGECDTEMIWDRNGE